MKELEKMVALYRAINAQEPHLRAVEHVAREAIRALRRDLGDNPTSPVTDQDVKQFTSVLSWPARYGRPAIR